MDVIGCADGAKVGLKVGFLDGAYVGEEVVGRKVGILVGWNDVGCAVGITEGIHVGGKVVGDIVGLLVEDSRSDVSS